MRAIDMLVFLTTAACSASPQDLVPAPISDADENSHRADQGATPDVAEIRAVLSDASQSHEERTAAFLEVNAGRLAMEESPGDLLDSEERSATVPDALDRARQLVAVTMYANQTCPVCRRARTYFYENDIVFVEYDVDTNPDARARYEALNPERRLPTLQIDDVVIKGFSELGVDRAMERSAKQRL